MMRSKECRLCASCARASEVGFRGGDTDFDLLQVGLGGGAGIELGLGRVALAAQHRHVALVQAKPLGVAHHVHVGGRGRQQNLLLGIQQVGARSAHQRDGALHLGMRLAAGDHRLAHHRAAGHRRQAEIVVDQGNLGALPAIGAGDAGVGPPAAARLGDRIIGGAHLGAGRLELGIGRIGQRQGVGHGEAVGAGGPGQGDSRDNQHQGAKNAPHDRTFNSDSQPV